MSVKQPVAVIGAGAWGTALAWSTAKTGAPVTIWALEPAVVDSINSAHENSVFLPGLTLPDNLRATGDMGEAVKGHRVVIFVAPSQFMRQTLKKLKNVIEPDAVLVSATKGIENDTLALPAEMIADSMPADIANRACFLSGPTFAKELIKKNPTAGIVASKDPSAAKLGAGSFIGALVPSLCQRRCCRRGAWRRFEERHRNRRRDQRRAGTGA